MDTAQMVTGENRQIRPAGSRAAYFNWENQWI